jgi:VWFA-related protein
MAGPSPASRRAAFLVAGALLVGLGAAVAQPEVAATAAPGPLPAQVPEETFAATIEVDLLDLQVVVTDRDGHRVHGLPAAAFRILVDGAPAAIELFSEVDGSASASTVRGATEHEAALTPHVPVNYLVFIDDMMTLRRNRDFVLKRLRDELAELQPGDRMAVVRLAPHRKLQMLTDWTGDHAVLRDALDRAMELDAQGIKYIALRRMGDFIANWEGNDTRRSILATAGAMRLLARPAGRRALLLVAGSWDPLETARSDRFAPWCVTGDCAGSGVFNVLTDTANLFGYAVYAVDVEGRDPDDNWQREKRLQSTLGELARVTGGQRLLNGERQRLLSTAAEDSRSYYSIGVTPPAGAPEGRLLVEVEILRDGLEARSQTAFVPLSPERDRQLDVLAAQWREAGAAATPLALRLGPVERLGGGRIGLTGNLAIPTAALVWQVDDGQQHAEVTLEVATVGWRGDSSTVMERRLRLCRPLGLGDHELVIPWPLELPRRRHTVVAGLRDHLARESFTVAAELAPRQRPTRMARTPAPRAPAALDLR